MLHDDTVMLLFVRLGGLETIHHKDFSLTWSMKQILAVWDDKETFTFVKPNIRWNKEKRQKEKKKNKQTNRMWNSKICLLR